MSLDPQNRLFQDLAHPWVEGLLTYEPGRPMEEVARELGFDDVANMLKVASNENLLGPSPLAMQAIRDEVANQHLYPDGGAFYLRGDLARHCGVDPDQVLPCNGSNEGIELLAHLFLGPDTSIVMGEQAFVVYRLVANLMRAETLAVPMPAFTHDVDAMLAAIRPDTRLLFIANPNNPTGTMVDQAALDRLVDGVPGHVVVVIDEAYIDLLPLDRQPDTVRYVKDGKKVFLMRTFSKTYGLAGLRVGYVIGPAEGISLLNKVRQPFHVNSLAQVAARAALTDVDFVRRTRDLVEQGLRQVAEGCLRLGVEVVPSVANFVLVKTGRGREICQALQRQKVIVRPMDGYGLPEYIRITIGTREQNDIVLQALERVLQTRTEN